MKEKKELINIPRKDLFNLWKYSFYQDLAHAIYDKTEDHDFIRINEMINYMSYDLNYYEDGLDKIYCDENGEAYF